MSTLKSLKLSHVAERTFCASCGTPITMAFFAEDVVHVTMGSVDQASLTCEPPSIKSHIFLSEKAPWVVLPDDGAERWGTLEDTHLVVMKQD
jgi:hypothetical protein